MSGREDSCFFLRGGGFSLLLILSGVRKRVWFPKGWFWQMFPCTKISSKDIFPCNATLAEERYDFRYFWTPRTGTRAHSPKPPFYKTALHFPFDFNEEDQGSASSLREKPLSEVGCTPRGSCNNMLLRRGFRRFSSSKCFLEGLLESP